MSVDLAEKSYEPVSLATAIGGRLGRLLGQRARPDRAHAPAAAETVLGGAGRGWPRWGVRECG